MISDLFLTQETVDEISREVGHVASQIPTLLFIRGPSSTGKSFLAGILEDNLTPHFDCAKIEADDGFWVNGIYTYFQHLVGQMHRNAQGRCRQELARRTQLVIISNTSCSLWEMDPYKDMAFAAGYMVMTIDLLEDIRARYYSMLERQPAVWPPAPPAPPHPMLQPYVNHLVAVNNGVHNLDAETILAQIARYQSMPWVVTLQQSRDGWFGLGGEYAFSWGIHPTPWQTMVFNH